MFHFISQKTKIEFLCETCDFNSIASYMTPGVLVWILLLLALNAEESYCFTEIMIIRKNKTVGNVSFYFSQLWIWRKRVPELGLYSSYIFTFNSLFYMVNSCDATFVRYCTLPHALVLDQLSKPNHLKFWWIEQKFSE